MNVPMSPSNIDAVAHALIRARRDQVAADATAFATQLTTPAEAYAVQQRVVDELNGFDVTAPPHWKSGGPDLHAITHAPLPRSGVWASPAKSGAWNFHQRGVEVEIALRLARDVDAALAATLDVERARGLIGAMAVSIEIVDSRWRDPQNAAPLLKLADLLSHGALVLDDWCPFEARDWATQTCRVQVGSRAVVERCGSHSLGDPALVLPAWLRHATREGATVAAGSVVTTGTWVGVLPAAQGDRVTAEFSDLGHAIVQL
jgi:2-keto-4-pentenoate hydratase